MQDVENLFLEVGKAIDERDISGARELLEEILTIDPGYGRAHNHLGWIYETKFKNFEKARQHYHLAIKFCKGDYPVAYVNYGYLLIEFGHLAEAEKIIGEGLKVKGADLSTLHYQKGKIAEHRKNYMAAMLFYKQARQLCFNKDFLLLLDSEIDRLKSKMGFWEKLRAKFMNS